MGLVVALCARETQILLTIYLYLVLLVEVSRTLLVRN